MSTYRALYLPTDDPLVDGCIILTRTNEVHRYLADEMYTPEYLEFISTCALFLVDMQFNKPVPLGLISPMAKWVGNGDEVLSKDIAEWVYDRESRKFVMAIEGDMKDISVIKEHKHYIRCWRIVCPMCGDLH